MKQEKIKLVYSCCGWYLIPTNANSKKKIVCPHCGKVQTEPVQTPHVILFKS